MSSRSTARPANLLDELQNALAHGTVARRVETLRRVTDLFLYGVTDYSDEQINVFDDVFHCLIEEIETSAKALLAKRMAPVPKAPPRLIYTLAFDDEIEVAAPVLSLSERLNDDMLIKNARSKSQGHMLAISKRKVLSDAVTDVLVECGNNDVVESTVNNPGAEFSDKGFTELVSRAEGNDNLATCLGARRGIPRPTISSSLQEHRILYGRASRPQTRAQRTISRPPSRKPHSTPAMEPPHAAKHLRRCVSLNPSSKTDASTKGRSPNSRRPGASRKQVPR